MVYRRKRNYKKRNVRRRSSPVATKGFVKKMVKKAEEVKFFDYTQSAEAIDYGGTVFHYTTLIPQGSTDSARVGDKLRLISQRMMFSVTPGDATNIVRIILAQYKGNIAVGSPTASTILQAAYVGSTNVVNAPYSHDYRNQWTILADRRLVIDSVAKPVVIGTIKSRMKYCKKQVAFVAAGTNASNHLAVLIVSDSAAVAHPAITYTIRTWFTDS